MVRHMFFLLVYGYHSTLIDYLLFWCLEDTGTPTDPLLLGQLYADGSEGSADESSEDAAADLAPDTGTAPDSVAVHPKGDYFSTGLSRKLLKEDAFKLKAQMESFVTRELFPELKFTVGDEEVEAQYCLLAVKSGAVQLGNKKIDPACFASEFRGTIGPTVSRLRQYAQNVARGKYQHKFLFVTKLTVSEC